jgi:hypothetical protein
LDEGKRVCNSRTRAALTAEVGSDVGKVNIITERNNADELRGAMARTETLLVEHLLALI